MPCSELVGALVSRIGGRASVAELLATLCQAYPDDRRPQVAAALTALRILYVTSTVPFPTSTASLLYTV